MIFSLSSLVLTKSILNGSHPNGRKVAKTPTLYRFELVTWTLRLIILEMLDSHSCFDMFMEGTAHYLYLGLGSKRNMLGK